MRKTCQRVFSMLLIALLLSGTAIFAGAAETGEWLARLRVHLLGDSTVCGYESTTKGTTGWGQAFECLFSDRAMVFNWAKSGATSTSFLKGFPAQKYGRLWPSVLRQIQAGDYVLIQFGHNDMKVDDEDYSGVAADETKFKENLTKMITETKAKGAVPVLVTPPERRNYYKSDDSGVNYVTLKEYPDYIQAVAHEQGVSCLDLHGWTKTYYEQQKYSGLEDFFATGDSTHFSAKGALALAKELADQIRTDANLSGMSAYLKDAGTVTEEDIFYPKAYLEENFELATTDDTSGAESKLVTNSNFKLQNSSNSGKSQTSVYAETDGNRALQWDKLTAQTSNFSYFVLNAQNDSFAVLDLRVMLPKPADFGNTATKATVDLQTDDWTRLARLDFTSTVDGMFVSAYAANKAGDNNRTLSFSNITNGADILKAGEWNEVRLLIDHEEQKSHLIVNGALICTDIPFTYTWKNSAAGKKGFRYLQLNAGQDNAQTADRAYFDDIRVYSVSDVKMAQMLLDGADGLVGRYELKSQPNRQDGYTDSFYLASSAKTTNTLGGAAMSRAFEWGTNAAATATYLEFTDNYLTTVTTPCVSSYLYAPAGYNSAADYDGTDNSRRSYFSPTIRVGSYTGAAGSLRTVDLKIKRRLLETVSDETIEIGAPRVFDVLISPDMVSALSSLPSVDAIRANFGDGGEGKEYWNQTMAKNTGTETRRILSVMATYTEQGERLSYMANAAPVELKPGESKVLNWTGVTAKNFNEKVPEGAVIKFLFIDADTMRPLSQPITVQ